MTVCTNITVFDSAHFSPGCTAKRQCWVFSRAVNQTLSVVWLMECQDALYVGNNTQQTVDCNQNTGS